MLVAPPVTNAPPVFAAPPVLVKPPNGNPLNPRLPPVLVTPPVLATTPPSPRNPPLPTNPPAPAPPAPDGDDVQCCWSQTEPPMQSALVRHSTQFEAAASQMTRPSGASTQSKLFAQWIGTSQLPPRHTALPEQSLSARHRTQRPRAWSQSKPNGVHSRSDRQLPGPAPPLPGEAPPEPARVDASGPP